MANRLNKKELMDVSCFYSGLMEQVCLVYDSTMSKKSNRSTLKLNISPGRIVEVEDIDIRSLHVMINDWEFGTRNKDELSSGWHPGRILAYDAVNVTEDGVFDMDGYLHSKGGNPEPLDAKTYTNRCKTLKKTEITMDKSGIIEFDRDGEEKQGVNVWLCPNYLGVGKNPIIYLMVRSNLSNGDEIYELMTDLLLHKKHKINIDELCEIYQEMNDPCHGVEYWRLEFKDGYVEFDKGGAENCEIPKVTINLEFEEGAFQYHLDGSNEMLSPDSRMLNEFIYQLAQYDNKRKCESMKREFRDACAIASLIKRSLRRQYP